MYNSYDCFSLYASINYDITGYKSFYKEEYTKYGKIVNGTRILTTKK